MRFIFLLPLLLLASTAFAIESVNYETMVTLPKIGGELNTENYIKALYMLSIGIAGVLAVIKIIFAGVKYMLSDVVTDKASAKKDIMGALLGLLIVLGAVLLLNTINADLTKLNIFENAPGVSVNIDETQVVSPEILTDALDIEDAESSCALKAAEGFEFRLHTTGDSLNPVRTDECCIPDSGDTSTACSTDSIREPSPGILIDTAKIYKYDIANDVDELSELTIQITNAGNLVERTEIALGNDGQALRVCEAHKGTSYIVQRERGLANTAPKTIQLCVIPNSEN